MPTHFQIKFKITTILSAKIVYQLHRYDIKVIRYSWVPYIWYIPLFIKKLINDKYVYI